MLYVRFCLLHSSLIVLYFHTFTYLFFFSFFLFFIFSISILVVSFFSFFFFNDTATTEIYTLSLHDALPISAGARPAAVRAGDRSRRDRRGAVLRDRDRGGGAGVPVARVGGGPSRIGRRVRPRLRLARGGAADAVRRVAVAVQGVQRQLRGGDASGIRAGASRPGAAGVGRGASAARHSWGGGAAGRVAHGGGGVSGRRGARAHLRGRLAGGGGGVAGGVCGVRGRAPRRGGGHRSCRRRGRCRECGDHSHEGGARRARQLHGA